MIAFKVLSRRFAFVIGCTSLVLAHASCQGEKSKTQSLRSSDFGETPTKRLPGSNDAIPEGEFTSMLNDSGESQPAVVTKKSTVESEDLSCPVNPGDKLFIVGKKELKGAEVHYVAQLAVPCEALGEGLISINDVKLLPFKDKPKVKPTPEVSSSPVPTVPNSCEEVTQIIIPGSTEDANKPGHVGILKGNLFGHRGCGEAVKIPKPVAPGDDNKTPNAVQNILASGASKIGGQGGLGGHGGLCMVPGPVFREQGIAKDGSKMAIKIKGESAKWKITASAKPFDNKWKGGKNNKYNTTTPETLPPVELAAAEFKAEEGTYVIPFDKFLPKTDWMGREIAFEVVPVDANGISQEDGCIHRFRLASPIVLDLTGGESLQTIHPAVSNVRFDFNADDRAEKTDWIAPTSGFLALDLNDDGKIESGRELFGEFTSLANGSLAENGFAALAQYDRGNKGYINKSDPVFANLRVWIDANSDGLSQPTEISGLTQLGISRINTTYSEVGQSAGMLSQGNVTLYQARFFGPAQCGSAGCRSYDVYFGSFTNETARVERKK